jgi:hypothetical protein
MRPGVLALLALAAGAAGGTLSSTLRKEALADASGAVVVPVPPQGVVFRGARGNSILRVRDEPAGGLVELLDSHEHVVVRLRATPAGGAIEVESSASPSSRGLSLARSLDDPGY